MKRLSGSIVVLSIFSWAGSGLALDGSTTQSTKQNMPAQESTPAQEITEVQAKEIALKLVPGTVVEVEREKHKGEAVFSIEVRSGKVTREIVIRIADGSVISNKVDSGDDGDED